jgi:hypothetical protein
MEILFFELNQWNAVLEVDEHLRPLQNRAWEPRYHGLELRARTEML